MIELKELAYCSRCGKLFVKTGNSTLCPDCQKIEDEEFSKVEAYLWEHPNSSISEVSEKTDVKEKIILKFIREGRIVNKSSTSTYPCKRCGKPITHGEYCDECLAELRKESLRAKKELMDKVKRDRMYIKYEKKKGKK